MNKIARKHAETESIKVVALPEFADSNLIWNGSKI